MRFERSLFFLEAKNIEKSNDKKLILTIVELEKFSAKGFIFRKHETKKIHEIVSFRSTLLFAKFFHFVAY